MREVSLFNRVVFQVFIGEMKGIAERFPRFFLPLTTYVLGCLKEGVRLGGWVLQCIQIRRHHPTAGSGIFSGFQESSQD